MRACNVIFPADKLQLSVYLRQDIPNYALKELVVEGKRNERETHGDVHKRCDLH